MGLALAEVRRGADATTIGLNHGYESTSGFRDAFAKVFGQPPGKARAADCIVTSWLTSPLGPLLVGATSEEEGKEEDGPGAIRAEVGA